MGRGCQLILRWWWSALDVKLRGYQSTVYQWIAVVDRYTI